MSINRRQALTAMAMGASGVLAAACAPGSVNQPGSDASAPPAGPKITYTPADAATDVIPTAPIRLDVDNGWFQRVALTKPDGVPVAGVINRDRTSFLTSEPLGFGVAYTWDGSAVGHDGKAVPLAGSFSTINPQVKVNGSFQLADGQTVGVAAPIIIQFDASISDKASVERAMIVTTTPPVEGSWAWLPDEVGGSRAHWRTREYYPAGTKVHVAANLYGVPFGDGAFGAQDVTLDFEIGRRQVVKAEASSHRIEVITDEGVILDLPCSYGEADLPRNVTRSGTHVVTEKYQDFYMSNPAAGYNNVHEQFAVRISNNGEFIHANPNTTGVQGSSNVTNGCINLSLSSAQQYFATAVYGDPVEVTGTNIELSYADGDIWDWAVDWPTWLSMSAITSQAPPSNIPVNAPVTPTDAPILSGTPTTTTPAPATATPAPGG